MVITVEMIVDFRRNPPALPPLTIMNSTVTAVESFRFLGTTISQDLKWDNHRHNKYLDASLAARPHVNGAAILVRATLHNSHIGTEENIPDSSAVWASTNHRTIIKTDLGVLSFTGKTEQLFLGVFWSFLALC